VKEKPRIKELRGHGIINGARFQEREGGRKTKGTSSYEI
jgi:hypothetical protein